MYDNSELTSTQLTRARENASRRHERLPRELAIAAVVLVAVMITTGLALWIVAGHTGTRYGQSQADTSVQTSTDELLRSLAEDLGPASTNADLEEAVNDWLTQQQHDSTILLASVSPRG